MSQVSLPVPYADFAYNVQTATVVAIDNARSEVLAFALNPKPEKELKPFATIEVGKSPCSICYKQFGEKHYFAVICSQDSSMYLFEEKIGSDEAAFNLVSQIDLLKIGISSVFASLNPEDPNIYFCYGGGHHSYAGAITLNSLKTVPFTLPDTTDAAISASGLVIYHRGPWSPSGLRAEIRTNSIREDVPIFSSLYSEHRSVDPFIPDPFDMYTAAGTELFARNLNKKVTTLSFAPLAYFRTKPIIVGINTLEKPSGSNRLTPPKVELAAISYNSFQTNGSTVTLDVALPPTPTPIPRSDSETSDFKKLTYRHRAFADDIRDRVLFAEGNQLFITPLSDFKLNVEPLLVATVPEEIQFVVGQETEHKIFLPNPQVKLDFDGMPSGMTFEGTTLKWNPNYSDVGKLTLTAHLTLGELKSTRKIRVAVECPSFELPFTPTGIVVDRMSQKGLIWDGATKIEDVAFPGQPSRPTRSIAHLAVIDLTSGKIDAQRELTMRIQSALVHDGRIFLHVIAESNSRIEILRLNDLQMVKSITTSGPILQMALVGENLVVQTQDQALTLYDTKSFELVRLFRRNPRIAFEGLLNRNPVQLVANGILWNAELKPELLLTSTVIPTMGKPPDFSYVQFAPLLEKRFNRTYSPNAEKAKEKGTIVTLDLDEGKKRLQVHYSNHFEKKTDSINQGFYESRIYLTFEETDLTTVMLKSTSKLISNFDKAPVPQAYAVATPNEAFIVSDRELFRWGFPKQDVVVASPSQPMRWNEKVTRMTLASSGKTELKHLVEGGKPPYSFSLGAKFDGLQVDEKSGTVTVDNLMVQDAAEKYLIEIFAKHTDRETRVAALLKFASNLLEPTSEILGRRPAGFPIA